MSDELSDPKTMQLLLKTIFRLEHLMDVLFAVTGDHACLVESLLERCNNERCAEPATVEQLGLGCHLCDACAARTVTNEDYWIDLEDAVKIRRMREYVLMLKKDDAPQPEHIDRLH